MLRIFQQLSLFQSPRTRTIDETLTSVIKDTQQWFIKPTIFHASLMLRKQLAEKNINISFDEACKHIQKRMR
jgi:hypothetical protein